MQQIRHFGRVYFKDEPPSPDGTSIRGALRFFLGGSGNSGPLAMLEAGRNARTNGVDVVVGYINPTVPSPQLSNDEVVKAFKLKRLLEGWERLPRTVATRDLRVKARPWFNVTAALDRAPSVVLLDSPIPSAGAESAVEEDTELGIWPRPEERDVLKLLSSGIHVWAALHLAPVWNP